LCSGKPNDPPGKPAGFGSEGVRQVANDAPIGPIKAVGRELGVAGDNLRPDFKLPVARRVNLVEVSPLL